VHRPQKRSKEEDEEHVHRIPWRYLTEEATSIRLARRPWPVDGNCLGSLADESYKIFRDSFMNHMFEASCVAAEGHVFKVGTEHLVRMRRPGEFGGHQELVCILPCRLHSVEIFGYYLCPPTRLKRYHNHVCMVLRCNRIHVVYCVTRQHYSSTMRAEEECHQEVGPHDVLESSNANHRGSSNFWIKGDSRGCRATRRGCLKDSGTAPWGKDTVPAEVCHQNNVRWTSVGLSMVQWANETEPQTDKDCECHQSPQFTESWSRKGTDTLMMTPGLYVWICNTPRPFNSDPEFLPSLFRSEITLRWRGSRRLNCCRRQVNLIPS
jgi:hypothetical protein